MTIESAVTTPIAGLWADWGHEVIDQVLEAATDGTRAALQEEWGQVQWDEAAQRYREQIRKQCSTVQIPGSPEPVPLEEIFTDLFVLDPPVAVRRFDLKDLREDPSLLERPKRIRGLRLVTLQEGHRLFILGKPGTGKTTFLKYLALQAVEGRLAKVPILISLRQWSDSGQALIPFLARQFETCGFPAERPFLVHLLKQGQALVLLDGLNEVNREGGERDRAIAALREFSEEYLDSQCLITCRVAATEYHLAQFKYVEIAEFADAQMQVYARKWFADSPWKQDRFLEDLDREEQRELRELGRTPLLLSMLCLTFDETQGLPQRQEDAYQKAVDTLLEKWETRKGSRKDAIYRWLPPNLRLQMLARIAAEAFLKGKVLLGQEELEEQIMAHYRRLLPNSGRGIEIDAEAELRDIEVQHRVLGERAHSLHSFSHLTLQEYLTARYIVEHSARGTRRLRQNGHGTSKLVDTRLLRSLFEQHLTDDRWREVFLLTASMLDNADLFFDQFASALGRLAREEDVIADLVSWAEEQAELAGKEGVETPGMRSRYLCYALALARPLARARNLARDRALARDHARDLARDLDRTRNLAIALDLDRDRARDLARDLDRARARDHARDLARARASDVDLDLALARARARARDLNLDLECAFARDLERECAFDSALASDLDRARVLALALDLDFERGLDLDLDRELALDRESDRASARERARELARDRARTLDLDLDFDFERARELAFDLDLAKAHSLSAYLDACRLFVACLERAKVSDREGWRDRLLRAPMARKQETSDGEWEAYRVRTSLR